MEKLGLICNGCGEERRFDDDLLINKIDLLAFIDDHASAHGSIDMEFTLDDEEILCRIETIRRTI